LTPQVAQSELRKGVDDGNTEAIAPPLGQNESTDQINDRLEKEDDSDDEDSDNDDAQGLDEGIYRSYLFALLPMSTIVLPNSN
jgi:hypothetical protein